MTLKVGERYKARNGEPVIIFGGDPFRGLPEYRSAATPIVYNNDGSTLAAGWAEWSIDGLTKHPVSHMPELDGPIDPRVAELASKRLASFEETAEAMRMRHDKTVKAVRANSDLIAGNAAKIEELLDRLDATDRRVETLRQGLCDHDDVVGKHETQINGADHGRKVGLVERIGNIQDRVSEIERTSEPAMVNRRLHQLATDITKLGSELARIEDMLTAEKPALTKDSRFAPPDCDCEYCVAFRARQIAEDDPNHTRKPKRVLKGGWVNVYRYERNPYMSLSPVIFTTKEDCKSEGGTGLVARIQIPDITEGEGL